MLTLDGTAMPSMGGYGTGTGLGVGGGVLGGLLAGGLAGAVLGGRGGWGGGGWGGNGYGAAPAAAAVATDVVLNPAFQSLQNQIQTLGGQMANNSTLEAISDFQSTASSNWNNINANINGVTRDILNGQANLATAQATNNFTTLNSINGLGRDITAAQTQALINNLQNFNNLQASQTTATNQILAGQAAQNANFCQCCCDIKQLIQSDGALTRSLINDLNVQNLRDQLTAANNKVSNNEQNQYLLSTILTHLHPTTAVV